MTDRIEGTQEWSLEDVDAAKRDVEEEDETGAPEKVAWPENDDAHPAESAEALREPPYERGEDVTDSEEATADSEQSVQDTS